MTSEDLKHKLYGLYLYLFGSINLLSLYEKSSSDIVPNISFCVLQKKESHTGLERPEVE